MHFRSQYEQTPGPTIADWTSPRLSWKQKVLRLLLYKVRQETPSPPGMSKLPIELLDMIFGELCGREVHAVRLVCTDWELAGRPFFADWRLKRSLFWVASADLRRLDGLASRFGPYMREVYIATDHFTMPGLWRVRMNYKNPTGYLDGIDDSASSSGRKTSLGPVSRMDPDDSAMPLLGRVRQPLADLDEPSGQYLRQAYRQRRSLSPWRFLSIWAFVWTFICGLMAQVLMRTTGQDRRRLARIAEMMPSGRLVAVDVSYRSEQLNVNEQKYGRASPAFPAELALLCGNGDVLRDKGYGEHVKGIVRMAMETSSLSRGS